MPTTPPDHTAPPSPGGGRAEARPQQDMFPRVSDASVADDVVGRRTQQLKSYKSLERLRDRILLASRELTRLRAENAELHRQVEELKATGGGKVEGTPLILTETPAVLRAKVESFIEAIDQYLQEDLREEIHGRGPVD